MLTDDSMISTLDDDACACTFHDVSAVEGEVDGFKGVDIRTFVTATHRVRFSGNSTVVHFQVVRLNYPDVGRNDVASVQFHHIP